MAARKTGPQPPRSVKKGRPPVAQAIAPRVKRRMKSAHVAVQKDSMLMEAAEGPRARWGATKPKVKKG